MTSPEPPLPAPSSDPSDRYLVPAEDPPPPQTVAGMVPVPSLVEAESPPVGQILPTAFNPITPTGRRYGFLCRHCSSRLEANDTLGGQTGNCPTCGKPTVIPFLDRRGRLIDPATGEVIKQDPLPMHAYAAAGERAPRIVKLNTKGEVFAEAEVGLAENARQAIECPRCLRHNLLASEYCHGCGLPFTMEATSPALMGGSNNWAISSLVCGILGIPLFCLLGIPALLAIIFGIVALNKVPADPNIQSGKGLAIAGIILGAGGLILGLCIFCLSVI